MYELIITEKPQAAKKISEALADGKALKKSENGVPYYLVTRGKKDIVVACAVGHLYGLQEKKKNGWNYPVFDVEWKPSSEVRKDSAFSKKYLNMIKKLAKEANELTIATDYDIEGEVIGVNIVHLACKKKDAARMKFSTLTKPDLVASYDHKMPHYDKALAEAGETRHILDYYYGINLSRALTHSIKAAGRFMVLSSGRVQGPALKTIVDREKEIQAFKSTPFWQLELEGNVNKGTIVAMHEKDKFWDKKEAEAILDKTKGKDGKIGDVGKKQFQQKPPYPFDLTTLQTEAYRTLGLQPKRTLEMAQDLYSNGFISYPRTSSQQLPKEIGYAKILEALAKSKGYSELCSRLLAKKQLEPNNGKKKDPAHPAMYPTGIVPKLDGKDARLYDLIVKRFLATFAEPATRETMNVTITVDGENFLAQGTRTVERGWHEFYEPFVSFKDVELAAVEKDDDVKVKRIDMLDKETQPPKRFTQASIIKELEKRGLGTKATRASIVETLFNRNYVTGSPIEATKLGIDTVQTLEKYSPKILDEELTRNFEDAMFNISEDKEKSKDVLKKAKDVLIETLKTFKKKEKEIGKQLINAQDLAVKIASTLGECKCSGKLVIKRGKFGRFIACDRYPECTNTYKLPAAGKVQATDKVCEHCKHPMIKIIKPRKFQELCLNHDCPSKKGTKKDQAEMKKVEEGKIEKECPKCKSKLVLRNSVYGPFYGCSKFPKCRHTEKAT